MNDHELDRVLNTWKAPEPPSSLREGLRDRFPRPERRSFIRPLRWGLAIAAASAALAIGTEKLAESSWDLGELHVRMVRAVHHLITDFHNGFHAHVSASIVARVRASDPKVYVNGQLAPPLEYGHAATMDVQVPGEGLYSIVVYPAQMHGWYDAGRAHDNVIEFQAGGKHVRIVCNKAIVDSERPVSAMRR